MKMRLIQIPANVCQLRRRLVVTRLVCALSIPLALLPAAPADAGLDQWTTHGPAGAGPVHSLAVDPNNPAIVYAGTGHTTPLVGGVFKSIDGGASWMLANHGLPDVSVYAVAVDPRTPSTVYAGTSGAYVGPMSVYRGMFKSVDGGTSWTPLLSTPGPAFVVSVAIDPQDPAIVYVGTANILPDTLWKSTNGGATWTRMSTGLANGIVSALAVDPHDSSTVYAGTEFGLFKSTSGGASWTPMNSGFTPLPNPDIRSLTINPQNPSTLYAGTGGFGVFKSIDGAATWTKASTGIVNEAGLPSGLIFALAMDPGRPDILYASSGDGVFMTTNGGANWSALNTGLPDVVYQALAISQTGTCLHTGSNNAGNTGNVFDFALVDDCGPLTSPVPNYQGLWWHDPAGSESGWGINFAHQGDTIFATWFTYDLDGKPWWLAVLASLVSPGVYSGDLFTTIGPPFNAVPFDPATVVETTVGTATFTFIDDNHATFAYTVNTASAAKSLVTQTKAIMRQQFGTLPSCAWGTQPNLALATNYQDLWWKFPASSESGWGINFAHQGNTIFATWFTYDADRKPWWLAFVVDQTAPRVYKGNIFTTIGPPFNAEPFDSNSVIESTVGTATLTFADGNNATFAYTVNGVSQTKPITRQVFAMPGTLCR